MRRIRPTLLLLLALAVTGPVTASAAGSPEAPHLRRWHVGVHGVSSWRSRYDVFEVPGLPPGQVKDHGRGGGFVFGYRFGDRFLVDVQLAFAEHDIAGVTETVTDADLLLTGTVLFRQRETLQPFLRGGFGGGGEVLFVADDAGHLFSFGTSAVAGGGCQVRLSSRFALELEAVATFTNFLEVRNESSDPRWTDESWQVRVSNQGWRVGAGVLVWF